MAKEVWFKEQVNTDKNNSTLGTHTQFVVAPTHPLILSDKLNISIIVWYNENTYTRYTSLTTTVITSILTAAAADYSDKYDIQHCSHHDNQISTATHGSQELKPNTEKFI